MSAMDDGKVAESKKNEARFTDEFKAGAVALVLEKGFKPEQVVRDLGLPRSSFFRWLKQARIDRGLEPSDALTSEERKRLRELEGENRRLKLEMELLKKWQAFSAKNNSK